MGGLKNFPSRPRVEQFYDILCNLEKEYTQEEYCTIRKKERVFENRFCRVEYTPASYR